MRLLPPPPLHGPKRSAWKDPKMNLRKKKNQSINSRNMIMRKGRLAVVFLGSIFPKTLKMHSQVKSLIKKTSILTYIAIIYHILLLITHTDCLLFLPYAVTKLNGRPERLKSVENEEMTGQISNVALC